MQAWSWQVPEKTRNVELVCGDWLGGALISANRGDSYTLYTVGNDGKLRWQHTLAGNRKAHAYNLQHLVHVLTQSPDGLVTTVTGLEEVTGEQKFELTVPASHENLTNVQRAGEKILCAANSITSPLRTNTSRLFVNIDGLAYLAFTENEWTLSAASCTPGSTMSGTARSSASYSLSATAYPAPTFRGVRLPPISVQIRPHAGDLRTAKFRALLRYVAEVTTFPHPEPGWRKGTGAPLRTARRR
ncbi:MAG TPA: hypothetical protein VK335_05460 [Bryobacteraceae bacterium]|nr:hypothetical protein [Bryobacteraceae bacterium]